jgi:hypothetical protein
MSTERHEPELTTIHRRLLTACEAMQRLAGDRPFQFTVSAMAELLGLEDPIDAWYIMQALMCWGRVVLVERGGPRRPSLYRMPWESHD